jgi:hypothetical protein
MITENALNNELREQIAKLEHELTMAQKNVVRITAELVEAEEKLEPLNGADIARKIKRQLDWRTPTGKKQVVVTLTWKQADYLYNKLSARLRATK